jgi:hypothetical protein
MIEAQNLLAQIEVANHPGAKKAAKDKSINYLKKLAYPSQASATYVPKNKEELKTALRLAIGG